MADWESAEYGRADPRARRAAKSSKAELLAAIAARRQAQLLRSSKALSPPSGMLLLGAEFVGLRVDSLPFRTRQFSRGRLRSLKRDVLLTLGALRALFLPSVVCNNMDDCVIGKFRSDGDFC
jgi:hypothetical protein